jgi:predicted TIM-barrel fold metal-dependent hydrolase
MVDLVSVGAVRLRRADYAEHAVTPTGDSGQILISADGHAGADIDGYKPYLERRYHDAFDEWAARYVDPWGEVTGPSRDDEDGFREALGVSAFDVPLNWESENRLATQHRLGVCAEVLFPNTAPPFVPSGAVTVPPPQTREEYEYRWAGVKAHNRWMADFCAEAPGQRAGFAQLFLNDIEAAVAEVYWAKEVGLQGVLLPADHMKGLTNLLSPSLHPLWAACEETALPVHRHTLQPALSPAEGGPGSFWAGMQEVSFYATRGLTHLLTSGTFAKFPGLKFVLTENAAAYKIAELLATLDGVYDEFKSGHLLVKPMLEDAVKLMDRKPSEYFATNCYVAGPLDPINTHQAGVMNLMWGSDIPHSEGTGKYTREAIRITVSTMDVDEIDAFLYKRAAHVYGFDVDQLQTIADGLGFTRSEVRTPLPIDEWPEYPQETFNMVFRHRELGELVPQ